MKSLTELLDDVKAKSTRMLDLSGRRLDASDIEELIRFLQTNNTVTSLNLYGCKIGNDGIIKLLNALELNKNIAALDIGANNITAQGLPGITQLLRVNNTIATLHIENNNFIALTSDKFPQDVAIIKELDDVIEAVTKLTRATNIPIYKEYTEKLYALHDDIVDRGIAAIPQYYQAVHKAVNAIVTDLSVSENAKPFITQLKTLIDNLNVATSYSGHKEKAFDDFLQSLTLNHFITDLNLGTLGKENIEKVEKAIIANNRNNIISIYPTTSKLTQICNNNTRKALKLYNKIQTGLSCDPSMDNIHDINIDHADIILVQAAMPAIAYICEKGGYKADWSPHIEMQDRADQNKSTLQPMTPKEVAYMFMEFQQFAKNLNMEIDVPKHYEIQMLMPEPEPTSRAEKIKQTPPTWKKSF